jgi:acyl-ACP thioesterase
MKNLYEDVITLRTGDFDRYLRITPAAVLDLFQEVAGAHAEELGIGFDDSLKKGLLWVLTKVRFEIVKQPKIHSKVKVVTWPLAPSKITLRRDYEIYSLDGELLIKGASEWVFIDSINRKIMPAGNAYPEINFIEKKSIEGKFVKARMLEGKAQSFDIVARYSNIDMNSHVNNTQYATFVLDAVNPTENDVIKSVMIDYHKEVTCDSHLNIIYCREEKMLTAKGECCEEIMFNCNIIFE